MGTISIRLTGPLDLLAIVDESDYKTLNLGSYNWSPLIRRSTTYAKTHNNRKTIYLHRLILGLSDAPGSVYVDHIDHNGLNNSRTNLRITDNKGNQRNSRKRLSAKNTSSYKGVHKRSHNKSNPWEAYITLSDHKKYLGSYRTEAEAATAYNQAATELFGPYAFLNIIEL